MLNLALSGAMGLNRSAVQTAIEKNVGAMATELTPGTPLNVIIKVAGQKIQYTAYKLSDGVINIGRIHGVN